MDEQDPDITVLELEPVVTGFLERLPQEHWELFGSFWIPLRQCLRSQQEAIQDGQRALEQARLAIRRSEREHEKTQRAIKELLGNTVLAQEVSTIPNPNPRSSTPDFVLDARLRTKAELNAMCASLVPDRQIAMLKTIPSEWARDKLASTRDVCWTTTPVAGSRIRSREEGHIRYSISLRRLTRRGKEILVPAYIDTGLLLWPREKHLCFLYHQHITKSPICVTMGVASGLSTWRWNQLS